VTLAASRGTLRALLQQATGRIDLQVLSLKEGARAALSVAVIIGANVYFDWPPLFVAALAALNTCMCDPGGPIRRRFPVLLAFTLLGALIMAGAGLARGGGIAAALPLGVFGIFCASFARIYGQTAQLVGTILGVMLVLAVDRPLPGLAQAATVAMAFIGGGLWATALTLAIWRIYPDRPAQRATAEVYRALAAMAEGLGALLDSSFSDETAWTRFAQTRMAAARAALETARDATLELQRARGGSGNWLRRGTIRLETAEQLLGGLAALAEILERADAHQRAAAQHLLQRLQPALAALANAIANDRTEAILPPVQSIATVAADVEASPESDPVRAIGAKIAERLRVAQTLSVPANYLPGAGLDGTPPGLRQRLLVPLAANLDWRSPALRHAARVAALAAPAFAFTMLWFTPYDHWLTITIVMTTQPYFGLTYARVLERIAGTIAGGLVAALVGLVCTTPAALAVAMFPLATITLAGRALSYGLFITWLTPLVVLLVDINQPGSSEWLVAGIRCLFTAAGGAVIVAGCFLLWPDFAPRQLAEEIRGAIATVGRYAASVLSSLAGEAPVDAANPARREAGIALNSLETTISRTLLEPIARQPPLLRSASLVDAALRRCTGRLTAMALDPATPPQLPRPAWQAWRDWVSRSSTALAEGDPRLPPWPSPSVESVARIARQFELMAGALERSPG
jgi:uncharacterized membrane protein YccC